MKYFIRIPPRLSTHSVAEMLSAEGSRFGGQHRYWNPTWHRNLAIAKNSVTFSNSQRTVGFNPYGSS